MESVNDSFTDEHTNCCQSVVIPESMPDDRLLRALLHPGEERAVFDILPGRAQLEALTKSVLPREIARLRRTYVVNYPIHTSSFHVEEYNVRIVNAQPYRNGGPVFVRYDMTIDGRVYSGFRSLHDETLTHEARKHAVRILASPRAHMYPSTGGSTLSPWNGF